MVIIFHIRTCDDGTLVNEKYIVSWKYMKSNRKCVFNVNFEYLPKQVPKPYFSMMLNKHKHMSHFICLLVPDWGEYEIGKQKLILSSISREQPYFSGDCIRWNINRPFNLLQKKVGCIYFSKTFILWIYYRHTFFFYLFNRYVQYVFFLVVY